MEDQSADRVFHVGQDLPLLSYSEGSPNSKPSPSAFRQGAGKGHPPGRGQPPLRDARLRELCGEGSDIPFLERTFSVPNNSCSFNSLNGSVGSSRKKLNRRRGSVVTSLLDKSDAKRPQPQRQPRQKSGKLGRLKDSFDSIHRGSGSSINISRKSYERLTGTEPGPVQPTPIYVVPLVKISGADPSDRPSASPPISKKPPQSMAATSVSGTAGSGLLGNRLQTRNCSIHVDENNIPQIDVAITPPPTGGPSGKQARIGLPLFHFSLKGGANAHAWANKHRPMFTSMKLRRHNRAADMFHDDMFVSNPTMHCPTLTITRDVDEDSLISDYITPSPYRFGGDPQFSNLGDDVSLYGTPKEDMSPFKDIDTARSSPSNYLKDQIIAFFQPSDNKLAMKLFGNKNALMKEKMRQKEAGNWVIHPCSNFRSVLFIYLALVFKFIANVNSV